MKIFLRYVFAQTTCVAASVHQHVACNELVQRVKKYYTAMFSSQLATSTSERLRASNKKEDEVCVRELHSQSKVLVPKRTKLTEPHKICSLQDGPKRGRLSNEQMH